MNYNLEVDTGWMQVDPSKYNDYTQQGLLFATVFLSGNAGWSINFTGVQLTYGPFDEPGADLSDKLSRFGDVMTGDLYFSGTKRIIGFDNLTSNPDTWTRFANIRPAPSTVFAVPGYDSVQESGFAAANRRNTAGSFAYARLGIAGTNARLETVAVNGNAIVPMDVVIGALPVLQFNTSGRVRLNGASLDLNTFTTRITAASGWGGPNAVAYTSDYPWAYDGLCAPGALVPLIATGNQGIENCIRPLYCWISSLIADIRDRGLIGYKA